MNAVSAPTPTGLRQSTRLIISCNTPGKVAGDTKGEHSVLVTELLNELNAHVSAEGVFNKTRVAVFRASNGAQMPSVSSSLLEVCTSAQQ